MNRSLVPLISLLFFSVLSPVYGRVNLDTFYYPSKVGEVPALKAGDQINISWVSSVYPNVLNLFCGDNVRVSQTDDHPAEGSFLLNVTSEWEFPCHFQMAKQYGYGWFDSGEMDSTSDQRGNRQFTADISCAGSAQSPISSPNPQSMSNASCPAATPSVCPTYNKGAQIGAGVGIGIGASVAVASIIGFTLLFSRRQRAKKGAKGQEAPRKHFYQHSTELGTSDEPKPLESGQPPASAQQPPSPPTGYVNGRPVELRSSTGPFELYVK